MDRKFKVAQGMQDFLPKDCFAKRSIEDKILKLFLQRGYECIDTPTLEYYDLFLNESGKIAMENLFKVSDADGELLVLRPEMTLPITRVASTKLSGRTLRKFCYVSNCFNFKSTNYKLREFTQAGVEVLGNNSAEVDAEIIMLAIETLRSSGLDDFLIDIGQVQFCKGLLRELSLTQTQENELISLIDKKDMFGLEIFGREKNIKSEGFSKLLNLTTLYGTEEVLRDAYEYASNQISKDAIINLQEIYEILKTFGYDKFISFDLSLVGGIGYYTGVVFKGLTDFFGAPLLGGGRYDASIIDIETGGGGAGFAIGVDNLITALKKAGKINDEFVIDCIIGFDKSQEKKAYGFIEKFIENGFSIDNSFCRSIEDLKNYAGGKNYKKLVFIDERGREVEV